MRAASHDGTDDQKRAEASGKRKQKGGPLHAGADVTPLFWSSHLPCRPPPPFNHRLPLAQQPLKPPTAVRGYLHPALGGRSVVDRVDMHCIDASSGHTRLKPPDERYRKATCNSGFAALICQILSCDGISAAAPSPLLRLRYAPGGWNLIQGKGMEATKRGQTHHLFSTQIRTRTIGSVTLRLNPSSKPLLSVQAPAYQSDVINRQVLSTLPATSFPGPAVRHGRMQGRA
ncbi:hypothetical protein B7494_g5892 [Chlorociboria aeruginascens]|nr:hypothetical protein B7494_g5892 [Chlorociboria aeruginascens]